MANKKIPKNIELLHNPELNKDLSFTKKEREKLCLQGLLPPHISSQKEETTKVLDNFNRLQSDLEKYI